MSHVFTQNVISPVGVFIHTSCVSCGCISGSPQASQPCSNCQQGSDVETDFKTTMLSIIKTQSEISQTLIRVFLDTQKKRPLSTASDRARHQEKFKIDSITRYNAQSSTSDNHILCSVLGKYIRGDEVIASHICGLHQIDCLPTLGKDFSFKWSPENCVLLFKPLKKLYDSMEVALLFDPQKHQVTFQVLYDHLLIKSVVSDFDLFEGYVTMSKTQKKKLRKSFQTYNDLNGKVLSLHPLALPSKTLLNWAAKSAYDMAMKSDAPHQCAADSMPSEEQWLAMYQDITPSANRLQAFIDDDN